MFNNIYEEERLFPYLNMSLDEARRLRYLISNFYAFKDGDLIQMSLSNRNGVVTANGLVYEQGKNKAFDSRIKYVENGIDIFSEIDEIFHRRFYSIDQFRFREKDIEIISSIEKEEPVVRRIPYPEESLELK